MNKHLTLGAIQERYQIEVVGECFCIACIDGDGEKFFVSWENEDMFFKTLGSAEAALRDIRRVFGCVPDEFDDADMWAVIGKYIG